MEILGPWLKNKGDELMLRAVVERFQRHYTLGVTTDLNIDGQKDLPEFPRFTFQPTLGEVRQTLQKRSLKQCFSIAKRGILPLLPQRVLRAKGLINARSLIALLDCSGFAYGDQWSPRRLISRTKYYEKLRRRGVKLIMLPQALGPFEDPSTKDYAWQMLDQFDLIFPREDVSERHVLNLGIESTKVKACPDISHLLEGRRPPEPEKWTNKVAIVPNARMLDKTNPAIASNYLDYLMICIQRVRFNKLEPVILLHETNDDILVRELLSRLDIQPKVIDEDGITSKGYLGHCYANLGSRYHSLVSSLSQATPSLGTSWAHKYEALFAEYECENCLISPALDADETAHRIDSFLTAGRNEQLRELLRIGAARQKDKVEAMWQRIDSIISTPAKIS